MNRLRELREDRDLRQIDVAAATGIDQKTLSNYETGKTNPDSIALIRLADFFHVSIDYLVGRVNRSYFTKRDILMMIATVQKDLSELRMYLE